MTCRSRRRKQILSPAGYAVLTVLLLALLSGICTFYFWKKAHEPLPFSAEVSERAMLKHAQETERRL